MRLELGENNKLIESDIAGVENIDDIKRDANVAKVNSNNSVQDEIKQQRAKFSELDGKKKLEYIFDYYKWFIVAAVVATVLLVVFIRDYRDNLRPVYIDVEMINSYFGYDSTNTVLQDYIDQYDINTEEYKIYVDTGITLSDESFDTTILANQQRLVGMYSAKEVDVVIGPVNIMEGPANCDAYGDLSQILPQDLIDELTDRDYEFYYFDPTKDDIEDYEDNRKPYFAGIYLDNCSYLNNNGEYGAYPVATSERDRVIFTIPANSERMDKSIEFLRFLVENR